MFFENLKKYEENNCYYNIILLCYYDIDNQRWIGSFFVTGKYFNGATKMKKNCF
jgi:hypothetical protein